MDIYYNRIVGVGKTKKYHKELYVIRDITFTNKDRESDSLYFFVVSDGILATLKMCSHLATDIAVIYRSAYGVKYVKAIIFVDDEDAEQVIIDQNYQPIDNKRIGLLAVLAAFVTVPVAAYIGMHFVAPAVGITVASLLLIQRKLLKIKDEIKFSKL